MCLCFGNASPRETRFCSICEELTYGEFYNLRHNENGCWIEFKLLPVKNKDHKNSSNLLYDTSVWNWQCASRPLCCVFAGMKVWWIQVCPTEKTERRCVFYIVRAAAATLLSSPHLQLWQMTCCSSSWQLKNTILLSYTKAIIALSHLVVILNALKPVF